MSVNIIDNSPLVRDEFQAACLRALEECGMVAESYAKSECPVDTGTLRNSINHGVNEADKYASVGTNSKYGTYVELGTGKFATGGGGRPTPWVYQDGQGNWHRTSGSPAQPFIKPSVADHRAEYREVIKKHLKNG